MKNFVETWKNRGYEKGETQIFWLSFLRDILKISEPEKFIQFEVPVKLKHKSFIDAFLPDSKVIIEQKSLSINLEKNQTQSDGEILSPYEQAQRYGVGLPLSMHPRFIIVCNFQEFLIYDMELMTEPKKILLEELPEKFHAFDFLINKNKTKIDIELELSLQAGEIVGKIYDALKKNYFNPNSDESLQSLNKLCVRLVFCLYAESSGVFGEHKIFRNFLEKSRNIRRDLILLFDVLNTPIENRDKYLEDELKIFPYVNGGLFAEKNIEIPNFSDEIKNLLLEEASSNFNWSGISPTIFGAVFESTLNPVTRREGGMHYTSVENIHRVIDPLFMDDLNEEFISCKKNRKKLLAFQEKISKLKFFDPACGSGNFLTESYISLRRLENKILKELLQEKILLGELNNPVKISINQFFGIEINDFAVAVAQTALWIAELQMLQETQEIIHKNLNPLPLKNFANIFEGNALRLDWKNICPEPDFIYGNPPFVGKTFQTAEQKADIKLFFKNNSLDYVACWYKKTFQFIFGEKLSVIQKVDKNSFCDTKSPGETISVKQKFDKNNFCYTKIQCAFVSTNSIVQGEQVLEIFADTPIIINFAYRTFTWDSESADKAHVHCVIIGFANFHREKKIIFDGDKKIFATHINFYLDDAPNIFLHKRKFPLQKNFPKMFLGNMPIDGGNLILSEDEKNILLKNYPQAEKFLKVLLGGEEFLHNKKRFCLWLVDANPSEIKKIPPIYERVKKVKIFRENYKSIQTQKKAKIPQLFASINFVAEKNFIAIPRVSSEKREYIPMDFLDKNFITTDLLYGIPDADLFLFGILESSVHMIWTKKFCGRLESRIRYSNTLIYNNFPFVEVVEKMREKICESAEKILEVRKKYFGASLADLYDENLMPKDLREAHRKNDKNVCEAYGFKNLSEEEILAELINLHKNLTGEE